MSSINYHTINGRIMATSCDAQGGSRTNLLSDALGSVVRTSGIGGTGGMTQRYSPYGAPRAPMTPGYTSQQYGYVGAYGYRQTNLPHSEEYVRARHFSLPEAAWTTRDHLWPKETQYSYAYCSPATLRDPSGSIPPTFIIPLLPPPARVGCSTTFPSKVTGIEFGDPRYSCASAACQIYTQRQAALDALPGKLCGGDMGKCHSVNSVLPSCDGQMFYGTCYVEGGNDSSGWYNPGQIAGGSFCCVECGIRLCCSVLVPGCIANTLQLRNNLKMCGFPSATLPQLLPCLT